MPKNSTVGDGSIVSKRRKLLDVQKTLVITVRAEDQRGDQGPPSDSWSWRKYGQKPIKGSPHPRGYYKCSSCKGCTARKQVERSSADASQLIVTYISDHNHPAPATTSTNPTPQEQSSDTVIAGQSGRAANNAVPRHAEGAAASSEPCGGEGEKESCDFFDELEELPSLACMVQQQLL